MKCLGKTYIGKHFVQGVTSLFTEITFAKTLPVVLSVLAATFGKSLQSLTGKDH